MPSAVLEYYNKGLEKRKRLLLKISLKMEKIEELLKMDNFFTNEEEYMLFQKLNRLNLEASEIQTEIENLKQLIKEVDNSNNPKELDS